MGQSFARMLTQAVNDVVLGRNSMILKRFFRYLLSAVVAFIAVAILIAVVWIGYFAYLVFTAPTHIERVEAERAEKIRRKAEEWTNFCAQYDCYDIPEGYVVKNIGQETLNLIHYAQPVTGDTCRLTTDSYDETEYLDGKVLRGAALNHRANPYFVKCADRTKPFTRWEDYIVFYRGQFGSEELNRNNVFREVLGPAWFWEGGPKPTYASLRAFLRPASQDFDISGHSSLENQRRVYLSKSRMFQGRYVVLFCNDRCDMQTVSFAEDEGLNTLHFKQLIQFSLRGWDCSVFTNGAFTELWKCGPPMEDHLDSMANYIRFLDQAVDAARRRPLPKLQ
ncbi:hypothetical protein RUA4292_00901 [Ruegeria atlantica]|uniref:Uncharacterized protein n=2 Tax=Ruegeria atlantica TaxID=81569 RepID=A0A0P1EBA5_9RHOB|nr:hypothetical protein RUA4292_00901 [Ruegeria atlantica]